MKEMIVMNEQKENTSLTAIEERGCVKCLASVLVALFWLYSACMQAQTAIKPDGSGTQSSPYQIKNVENLVWIGTAPSAYYHIVNDIDATKTANWDGGFPPINSFWGVLDGKGHTIRGLTIKQSGVENVGIFKSLYGTVQRLNLAEGNITGGDTTGALVGSNIYGTITECCVTGSVTGGTYIGGIAGYSCGTLQQSYSRAVVRGDNWVGGLIGYCIGAVVTDCYAAGKVGRTTSEGYPRMGGLFGFLCPINVSEVSNTYWDKAVTAQPYSNGNGFADKYASYGKTTAQMKQQTTYSDWNFSDLWAMDSQKNGGYPYLRVFTQLEDPNCKITSIERENGVITGLVLSYEGTLQYSTDMIHWQDVEDATGGTYSVDTTSNTSRFYRVKK